MHLDQKQPEFKISDLDVLGFGSFNVAFKYTDQTDNKKWVIKVSKENSVTDNPERSVFLWNLFHPQNKAKLCKVNDRQAWMCPFFVEDIDIADKKHCQPLMLAGVNIQHDKIQFAKEDEKLANLIIKFYKQTQRIVLDIFVRGNIIGDKLVDVGFAFFAPSKKGRERRGSVASAAANNDCLQKDFKQRYSDPSRTNVLHALVAIARQLADTPENKDFKANFSTVDNFDQKLFDKYKS